MNGRSPDLDAAGSIRPEPTIGNQIGSYRLVRLLGGRAGGPVYEVEDLARGGRAAMRVLPTERAAAFGAVRRLFIEMRALDEFDNPHLVAVTDLIEAKRPGEESAIVMELLDGRSLGRLMAVDKTLPIGRVLSILDQVLDALRGIHQAHLIHGDLKPDNIFLTSRVETQAAPPPESHRGRSGTRWGFQAKPRGTGDYVKLLGFGLARSLTGDRVLEDGWADEDTSINTPAYLAPEQAFGNEPDHRSDIYSFGVILYQLLCGRLPFGGRNLGELLAELEMDSPRSAPRHVLADPLGRTLDSIARRCLAKDPARRWSTVDELKRVFDSLLSGQAPEVSAGVDQIHDPGNRGSAGVGWWARLWR